MSPRPAARRDLAIPSIPPLTRPLGRHLGTGPGMLRTVALAKQLGCTTAQIFPGNPKGWRHVPLTPEVATAARSGWAEAGVKPLTIHTPYLINLASPDDLLYANSTWALRDSLARAVELGAPFVTVHLGSHKGTGHEVGAARLIAAAHTALEGMPDWLYLLLENNVGSGNSMGNSLEALGSLVRDAAHPRIGVCIDTAHLWGAGYDLGTAAGVEQAVGEIDRTIGLPLVRLLHVNDSPVGLGSRRDQHAHLGQGNIGYVGLAAWLTHPGLAGLPVILETPPHDDPDEELVRLRTAALLCAGDAEGARAYQESFLVNDQASAATTNTAVPMLAIKPTR